MAHTTEFDEFVVARSPRLLRLAYLLTQDHALAEDLLQTALARSWSAWRRIDGDPEPYVRRVLVNAHNSWWRRRTWAERPVEDLPVMATTRARTIAEAIRRVRAAAGISSASAHDGRR